MKALQIFKPGKHTALDGRVLEFTEADLRASAAAYDPALHEAPIVVGHPKADAPAYGWVKSLAFDRTLDAEPTQVDAQFAAMVNAGRFKKISASFYLPDAPENPKPGAFYLRHVGFLGAQAPAVKGLKSASFAASEKGIVEFGDWSDQTNASLWRRMRDWIISQVGLEKADAILPDYQITSLEQSAMQPDAVDDGDGLQAATAYAEHPTKEQVMTEEQKAEALRLKTQKEELDRKSIEFAEREKTLKANEAAQARVAIVGTVDGLIKAGKILPAQKDGLVAFMAALPAGGVVEFGEGDKKVSQPAGVWLAKFLSDLPKVVEFKELGAGDGSESAELDASTLAAKAVEFVESERVAGRVVNTAQAVEHVKKTLTRS